MRYVFVIASRAFAVAAAALVPPASAIDCSRAASVVEMTICANKDLRKSDARFNRDYANLLERLDARQRRDLVASQKAWLAQREALCKAGPSPGVADCVAKAMSRRQDELAQKFSAGGYFGLVRLGTAGQTLVVGHQRLDVVRSEDDSLRLVHGNTVIAESFGPFTIEGRAGDDNGEAVVVLTSNGKFPEQYLVSSLPDRPLRAEVLSAECSQAYSVDRKLSRLELRALPSPGCDGDVRTWSVERGLTLERKLEFVPKRGTTVADLREDESPTDIEQFYNSLKRLAPNDWRPMARALLFATNRLGDNDKYVRAECSVDNCRDVFATYAKANETFYFAHNQGKSGVKYFPDRSGWPSDLARIVDDWVKEGVSE